MLPLLMLQLIVILLLLLSDVADGCELVKGPWSTNSSVPLTGHGCCCQPRASPKFNFSFLFPFFGNRATTKMTLLFPPNCFTGPTFSLPTEAIHSKSAPPTSNVTRSSVNDPDLHQKPRQTFLPHRNSVRPLSSPLRPFPPRWLPPPSSPPHAPQQRRAVAGPPRDRNTISEAPPSNTIAVVEFCHFTSAPRSRLLNIYCPSRVNPVLLTLIPLNPILSR